MLIWIGEQLFISHLKKNMIDKPNMNYIEKLADGDKEFEQQFITILKEEFPKEKEVYLKSITANDFEGAWEIVHKLKHKFNILGMENAYILSVKFEDELKKNNMHRNIEFIQVLDIMGTYIKKI
ncbi:MAG: HPt (histidine-containing phosphotransfer) domain-containing protein [Maribacter sp.]|jgi:HPt (histidine-containing phosphotransfer) domain-containing protein